jgi:hypothetical protein
MKLPYPFEIDGELVEEFEIKEATTATIAEAQKHRQAYAAIKAFLQGVLASLNGNADAAFLKNAILVMPFESAFAAVIYGMAETRGDDTVVGEYKCPHCGAIRRYESIDGDDDLTDRLSRLPIDTAPLTFDFDIGSVDIVDKLKQSVIETINTITMTAPTLEAFIRGERRFPDSSIFVQNYAYTQTLTAVNGRAVDKPWRDKYGEVLFNKLSIKKVNEITKRLAAFSPFTNIERVCLRCARRWKTTLDLTHFFDYGAV